MRETGRWVWVAFLSLLVAGGCQDAGRILEQTVKKPEAKITGVRITGISRDSLELGLSVEVKNPNPVGISLAGLLYRVELAGHELASGETDQGLAIPASASSGVEVPVSLDFREAAAIYDENQGAEELPYAVSGEVRLDTPFGPIPVPFKASGTLPVVRRPRISGVDIKVNKLSLSGADLLVGIKVENPNSFPLSFQKLSYSLALEGKSFAQGQTRGQDIPPKAEGEIEIPVSLDLLSLGSWAYSLLNKGSADYRLDYGAEYLLKGHPVKHQETQKGRARIRR